MALATREQLLGASDIKTREIDLPSIQMRVKVRSLPAAYSNQAQSEALEMITGRREEQTARVNIAKLECLQVLHGLVEPKLNNVEDAQALATAWGPAWRTLVDAIDEISGIDKKSIEDANARFQSGGSDAPRADVGNGTAPGGGRPDIPLPAGA